MRSWPPKAPGEILEYEMDWGRKRLKAGEEIIESTWDVIAGSCVVEDDPAPSIVGGITRVWLSGGVLGETCIVTNHIKTNQDREPEWSGKLKIKVK